jgi:hypothetical protein
MAAKQVCALPNTPCKIKTCTNKKRTLAGPLSFLDIAGLPVATLAAWVAWIAAALIV